MEYKWHVMGNKLDQPPYKDMYIVSGFVIKEGRKCNATGMAYWSGSDWGAENHNMVVESWTDVPKH